MYHRVRRIFVMAQDLSVAPLTAAASVTPVGPVAELPEPTTAPSQTAAVSLIPSPELRIDPASGIVVIEFRSHDGKVINSIPSQQQLDAYNGSSMTTLTNPLRSRIA
jgi:hypothetical protein